VADQIPSCAVVIPTYNGAALTRSCLETLLAHPPSSCTWTIVVVDDGSTDGTPAALGCFGSDIQLVELPANSGFASACNAGAHAAGDCDYVVFLNNDTIPTPGWLDALIEEMDADPRVAVVGARLLFPTGQVQHAGVVIGQDGWPHNLYAGFPGDHPAVMRARPVVAVTGACLLVRRSEFDRLGGFDTAFHNVYEDVDLCLRLGQDGHLIRYRPDSLVYHLESVTRWRTKPPTGPEEGAAAYEQRWASQVAPDDLQHYVDDGLLGFSYGAAYPAKLAVSPELAVVRTDRDELAGLERLLEERSRKVMELIAILMRRELGITASFTPLTRPPTARSGAPEAKRVADGREHVLGGGGRHLISVLLPVKDGAQDLRELLPLVMGQKISARVEIVAVDSGSEDDTIEVLEQFGATVLSIDPTDFDHGLTRNVAAEHARGDVLVFLNKRARPVGDRWLAPLIAALDHDPDVVGVCSRVIPDPDADILTRKDGEAELSASPVRQRKQIDDWSAYRRMSAEQRRVLLNFHTVSAAIRAEALQRIPFRSVRTIGEDLLWAREVVESGWALVHEPASVAYHVHSYTPGEWFSRNVDDGIANRDIVGRSIDREEIVPGIRAMVRDDWSYLRQTLAPGDPDLDHWQLESVLRRVAQVLGQWVGVNYETLAPGTAVQFSRIAETRMSGRQGRLDGR
jgi:GT2 family glycosyltransferase